MHRSCTLIDSSLSVSLKLTSLHDYYQRLLHGSQPVPSGLDMANTLKFFSQMLLCKNFDIYIYIYIFTLILCNEIILFSRYIFFPALLKEVREAPLEMVKSQKYDAERMALYPNLDYKQLYNALTQLIDVVSSIHIGLQGYKIYHFKWSRSRRSTNNSFLSSAFGQALLQCIACLLPFLDHDLIDNVAYLTASSISVLPLELHQDIVNYLCFYILPFTISKFFFFFSS